MPSLIMLLATSILFILLGFILKNWKKSGLILSLGLVLFFSYGHTYIIFNEVFDENFDENYASHLILLTMFLFLFILGTYFFLRTNRKLYKETKILNAVAISLIALSSINIATYYFDKGNFTLENIEEQDKVTIISNIENYPDIYFIILDEYADDDKLKDYLNYNNSEFILFLKEKGFFVASESYSNYPRTLVSVPSTLNMEYVHLIDENLKDGLLTHTVLKQLTTNNKVMNYLKSKNYTTISFSSGHIPTNEMNSDLFFCQDEKFTDSELLPLFLRTTMLNPIHVKFFETGHRATIMCIFSGLTDIPNLDVKPKFVFAHIMLPHQPYIFGPNGEPLSPEGIDMGLAWREDLYLGQLEFANKKMKEIIPKLLETDNPPVIIIQSDHGFRHGQDFFEKPTKEFLDKRYNNFKAYYFPGKERNLLFEETTNVNSFRILFNIYFNDKFELLKDKIWSSPNGKNNLNFTDVTEILFEN